MYKKKINVNIERSIKRFNASTRHHLPYINKKADMIKLSFMKIICINKKFFKKIKLHTKYKFTKFCSEGICIYTFDHEKRGIMMK